MERTSRPEMWQVYPRYMVQRDATPVVDPLLSRAIRYGIQPIGVDGNWVSGGTSRASSSLLGNDLHVKVHRFLERPTFPWDFAQVISPQDLSDVVCEFARLVATVSESSPHRKAGAEASP